MGVMSLVNLRIDFPTFTNLTIFPNFTNLTNLPIKSPKTLAQTKNFA